MGTYILSKPHWDYSFIILPGLFSIVLLMLFGNFEVPMEVLAIFAFSFAEAGHVYVTIWRYDHIFSSSKWEIFLPLIGFFLLFFVWMLNEFPYMWSLVIYVTWFHNMRQIYGVSRWYQKVNHKFDSKLGNYLFYFLHVMPGIIFHFRSSFVGNYDYPLDAVFFYPNQFLYNLGIGFYILSWVAWFVYQFRHGNMKKGFLPVFLFPFVHAIMYAYSFLVATNVYEVMIPLVVSHGLTYMALVEKSHRVLLGKSIVLPIIITCILGGIFDFMAQAENVEMLTDTYLLKIALLSLAISCIFTHYWVDMFIWKSSHKDAKKIYA